MPSATCETCIHWRAMRIGARNDGPSGECRATPPVRDYAWPRTKAHDGCGKHAPEVSFATPAFVPPKPPVAPVVLAPMTPTPAVVETTEAAPIEPPLAEAAPLILDAGTTGEAPPAGATTGGTGNRPRSRGR